MNETDKLIESMADFKAKDAYFTAVAIPFLTKLIQQMDDILATDERTAMSPAPHLQRLEIQCSAVKGETHVYYDSPGGTLILCKCGQLVPRSGDELHEIRNIRSNEP